VTPQPPIDPSAPNPSIGERSALLDFEATWYPLAFVQDLDVTRPTSVSVYDRPLVLFRGDTGAWTCLLDRCPHRNSKLSDGELVDGKLECLYHGWQFDGDGQCARIPQLDADKPKPARANLSPLALVEKQGMLWVWLGDSERADEDAIPSIPELDDSTVVSVDFMMDLPYEQSYLVENVFDVAHIHIAHHGMRGGGDRAFAKPLEFEIDSYSIDGIRARFRTVGLEAPGAPDLDMAQVELKGQNLIWYRSQYKDKSLCSGLALYCLPLGAGRCRLLYRSFSNFWPAKEQRIPRWVRHGTLCTILEQDMNVVVGQSAWIDSSETHLQDDWLPLKSSDTLVVKYRKWLDEFGGDLPNNRGFATSNVPLKPRGAVGHTREVTSQRYLQHTQICSSCSDMHTKAERIERVSKILLVVLLVCAVWFGGTLLGKTLGVCALLSGVVTLIAQRVQNRLVQPAG
jgi:phenylpropionate dioxygenase-like ring-hydroxylating dioxygenase large terminal subunit